MTCFCGSINSKNFQKHMEITQKRLSPAERRRDALCRKHQAQLANIPTPELLPMAAKAMEYFL